MEKIIRHFGKTNIQSIVAIITTIIYLGVNIGVIFFSHINKDNESIVRESMTNLRAALEIVFGFLFISQYRKTPTDGPTPPAN